MKLSEVKIKNIPGTNCFNCSFIDSKTVPAKEGELNKFGGIHSTDKKDLAKAKGADLITMPGTASISTKKMCTNKDVTQFVTAKQCCNFWHSDGVIREFE